MANEISTELLLEVRDALRNLEKLEKASDKTTKSVDSGFKKALSSVGVFGANLASSAVIGGFRLIGDAARALFNTFREGIGAAQVQEDAINNLNVALRASGQFTQQASKDFQDFASSIQAVTRFGDEVIIQNAALLQSLGQLSNESLKGATQASVDLAAALNIDLRAAVTLVGKAATGEIGSFSRYGLVIQRGANNAETFSNVLTKINDQFGGAAAGQVRTFSGATEQLSNTFGDLTEELGKTVTQNSSVIAVIKSFESSIRGLSQVVIDNQDAIKSFVTNGLLFLVQNITPAINAALRFREVYTVISIVLNELVSGVIANVKDQFLALGEAALSAARSVASFARLPTDALDEQLESIRSQRKGYQDLVSEAEKSAQQRVASVSRENAAIRSTTQAIQDQAVIAIEEAQKRTNEEDKQAQQRVESKKSEFDALAELEQIRRDQIEEQKLLEQEAQLVESDENFQFLSDRLGREAALRATFRAKELAAEGKAGEAKKVLLAANAKAEQQGIFEVAKFEDLTQRQRLANFKGTLGTIASLQSNSNKTLFTIGKAAAIGTATIDGIAAVQKALASAPPPFNFALAALVGVATGANIAKIASQQPPAFQEGGIVPGSSFSGDQVLARLNSGEAVLTRNDQALLFRQIRNPQPSEQVQAPMNQTIVVEVDGRAIAEAVVEQRRQGFAV